MKEKLTRVIKEKGVDKEIKEMKLSLREKYRGIEVIFMNV
jgi:hypothetical protein